MAKSPKRKEYLNEYKQDENGSFSYSGKYYRLYGDAGEVRKIKIILILGVIAMAAPIVGSGCIDAAGATGAYYVVIPMIGEFITLFVIGWNVVKLLAQGEKVKGYVLDQVESKVPPACIMLMAFAIAGACFAALYITFNGFGGKPIKCFLYLILKIATACIAFLFKKYYNNLDWRIV